MRHDFFKALRRTWRACLGGEGPYRPDLHYMRGPGPKWHAKYGHLAPRTALPGSSAAHVNRGGQHRS